MNELDEMLSRPLPAVADGGFSAHVMRRVRAEYLRRHLLTVLTVAASILLVILVLPLHAIGAAVGSALPLAAGGWAISFAAGVVFLSLIAGYAFARE